MRAMPTISARELCRCAACGRPYPAASGMYHPSVLALANPAALPGDAAEAIQRGGGTEEPRRGDNG